jgi:hypothetical protein
LYCGCMGYGKWLPVMWRNILSSVQKTGTVWNIGMNQTTCCNKPEEHNIKLAWVYTSSEVSSSVGGSILGQQQTLN